MKKKFLWGVLVIAISLAIEAFFFKGFLLTPNQYINPFGGDGYYIAYHMNFHTQHGDGLQLASMNHPHGEVIFMTDAQAVISIALNKLLSWGVPVGDKVIGVMNSLNFYLIPLAILFIFLTFVKLEVAIWYAIPISLCIGFLSPQIARITVGHYGLGYPFLLPLLIYWMMVAEHSRKWFLFSGFVAICLLLLGLNNFYLLLMGGAFCFIGALLFWVAKIFRGKDRLVIPMVMGAVCLVPMLIGFVLIKSVDHVEDRVKVPNGFLTDLDVLPSLFHPPKSFVFDTVGELWKMAAAPVEGAAYLGIVPGLILLICLIHFFVKGEWRIRISDNKKLNVIFGIGVAFLLLAMHFPFYGAWKEWGYEIPVLPQFRAQRRFVWGFYYGFTILMGYWGYRFFMLLWKQKSRRILAIICLALGALIWANDARHFLTANSKDIFFKNPFTGEKLAKMESFAKANNITKENYQGIYMLPTMNSWTDKVLHSGSWHSYFPGLQLCNTTGIPMMNLMLSRVSVEQSMENLQMVSHPLISRKLYNKLPNKKPILLFKGKKAELHENEEWLLLQGDTIANDKDFVVLSFDPWNTKDSTILKAQARFTGYQQNKFNESDSPNVNTLLFEHYDDEKTELAFYGKGAKKVTAHQGVVWEGKIPNPKIDTSYEASLWVHVGTDRPGLPFWKIQQRDKNRKLIDSQRVWSMRSRDTQNGWIRVTIPFELKAETDFLQLESDYNFDCWMDEFLIREKSIEVFHESEENPSFFFL